MEQAWQWGQAAHLSHVPCHEELGEARHLGGHQRHASAMHQRRR